LNLLDENFPADQVALLRAWRIPCRQIGRDISHLGVQDQNVIPLLHRLKRVTFFTQDEDFFKLRLCHRAYCLVLLDMKPGETADYVRRFLRHPAFTPVARRMGTVARANVEGVQYWRRGRAGKLFTRWPQ
jgi:hypothetical protein